MNCPYCFAADTKVIDSRLIADGTQVRRRRQCIVCHERFNTFETFEMVLPFVIKRDNRRELFRVDKLRAGILRALEKRPVSADAIEDVVSAIMAKIRCNGEREITSCELGEWVMAQLYNLDHVAYVRFASVYKRFQDVSEFRQTIDEM